MRQADSRPSRRAFLGATGTVTAVGLSAGCQSSSDRPDRSDRSDAPAATPPVSPTGRYQAGITLPQPAQRNLLAVVADLVDAKSVRPLLAELGEAIGKFTTGTDARLMGLEPGDLTVTIGVGPRLVRKVDPALP
ncbi:peroxidase, partial [Streptomyces sp. MCAF7]